MLDAFSSKIVIPYSYRDMVYFLPHNSRRPRARTRLLSPSFISRQRATGFEPLQRVSSAEKHWQALHKKWLKHIDHASKPAPYVIHIRSDRAAQRVVQHLPQGAR